MVCASGPPRDHLVNALVEEAWRRPPNIPPLPESFLHYRRELGLQVYGAMGIAREDKAGHDAQSCVTGVLPRPAGGHSLHAQRPWSGGRPSVGMFVQTLLLALTERGLGSCVEVSIAGYPDIVRAQLAIPAELSILCGLAVGFPTRIPCQQAVHNSRANREERGVPGQLARTRGLW